MVPMRLFAARAFSAGVTASFLFYAGMYGVLFFLPQFFQSAQGADPLGAGLRLLPWTATLFVFAPIGGSLVKRFGERQLVSAGLFTQAIGFAWIALIATPELAFAQLVAPLLIAGAGVSLAMPASQNAVLSAVAPAEIGKASGCFNMARFLGGVFGVALLVAVFDAHGSTASPQSFSDGFRAAILVSALLSLAGAFAAIALPGKAAARLASLSADAN
jgi:MFS family permease